MHQDACGCIRMHSGTNENAVFAADMSAANNAGCTRIKADTLSSVRSVSSAFIRGSISSFEFRFWSVIERSSVFPEALRARVTNGATILGETSFAVEKRRN